MINKILSTKNLSLKITITLFVVSFLICSLIYPGFFSWQNFFNLFIDNSFLLITAIGMTFVILTGGIDLSVGSVIAFVSMVIAFLLQQGLNAFIVIPLGVMIGGCFGAIMGLIIQKFKVQPFIVTLAGMFLIRGLSFLISVESISIKDPIFNRIANYHIPIAGGAISVNVVLSLVVLALGMYLAHFTKFGRTVYAIGGDEESAQLMGLKVGRTKVLVYTLNGLCSGLAGVAFSLYMLSGYGLHAEGLEMDSIASVVIGGTLLTGGSGFVFGTLFGVLIQGLIQTVIMFQGTLSSWWTKIFVGILLFVFIVLQKVISNMKTTKNEFNN
ncbi:galactofuranose ABC transporter, permease protein YjfF [Halanaerobium salsuginis]|uniref:Simple sugar transport system permease protein n=1 Tax=Halanaerobium salsuginis TaxID=29563 RepID=A0A1I4FPY6_9FIRM|nr:galactofuranose ABC transporter, permease protein YjfF [Halanaerobium salsuginis]SFL19895.1 simple sugar transport system permease protein [Halanaerobium salsuginis]